MSSSYFYYKNNQYSQFKRKNNINNLTNTFYNKKNGNIFETLTGHLINAGIYPSWEDALKDLDGNQYRIINKCRSMMSDDQADFYDKIINAISKKNDDVIDNNNNDNNNDNNKNNDNNNNNNNNKKYQ